MDPHGADQRGNPLGGLMFTQQFGEGRGANASGTTNGTQWTQVMQWHNFMGANMFCLKSCDPADDVSNSEPLGTVLALGALI